MKSCDHEINFIHSHFPLPITHGFSNDSNEAFASGSYLSINRLVFSTIWMENDFSLSTMVLLNSEFVLLTLAQNSNFDSSTS